MEVTHKSATAQSTGWQRRVRRRHTPDCF